MKERLEKRLESLLRYRDKIEKIDSLHIVEHKFLDVEDSAPIFIGDKDAICHGLSAAGDISGGFKLIKEGLLKEIDFDIQGIRDQLGDI